ncbi:MAG: fibronectin type III domain-containing protein, partial [Planctomycetia bacterium]|nr:fibronectin type III domain-containing protein [Planctomycetia bacterium]
GSGEDDGSAIARGDGGDVGWVGGDGEWDPSWTFRSDADGSGAGDDAEVDPSTLPHCWVPAPLPVTTTLAPNDFEFTFAGPGHAPTGVVATPSADGIVVTWQDAAPAPGGGDIAFSNGYLVEMRRLRDASWSLAGTTRDVTSLSVTGLDAGAHYVFRVTKTNVGALQVLSSPSLPSRPVTTASAEGITVGLTDAGGARIAWDAVAGGGERIVEYRRLASAEWTRAGAFPGDTGVATIDGLAGGRHYTFRILSPTGVYTPRTRAITTPDQANYLLGAVAGPSGTVVNWSDPSAATRTETVVEYRRLKDVAWSDLGSVASAAGTTTIDGLVPNANYVFRLRQRDANGQWSRTVATRPVTVSPDCVFPPACVDYPPAVSGTMLVLSNPLDRPGGTLIAGLPADEGTVDALVATGKLEFTGALVGGGAQGQPEYFLSGTGDDPTA